MSAFDELFRCSVYFEKQGKLMFFSIKRAREGSLAHGIAGRVEDIPYLGLRQEVRGRRASQSF